MKATTPIDGWSAYYTLLSNALASPYEFTPRSSRVAKPPRCSLMERLDHWFSDQRTRARERYLAESSDLCQLESRMRELNRYY